MMRSTHTPKRALIYGIVGFVVFLFLGLTGCKEEKAPQDPEGSVKKLAETYWTKRLIEKDFKGTYEMELVKGSLPFSEYEKRVAIGKQITYESVSADEVTIAGDQVTVKMKVRYRLDGFPEATEGEIFDTWVLKDGEPRHVLLEKTRYSTRETQ